MEIAEIDKNFAIVNNVDKNDCVYRSVNEEPFRVYGVFYFDGKFRRMDEGIAKKVSLGVSNLHANTAGGRIRFRTDSEYVALRVRYGNCARMNHFSLFGTSSFDLYADGVYVDTFKIDDKYLPYYNGVISFDDKKMRSITINMPSYAEVEQVEIGLADGAKTEKHADYKYEKPIVYYGSSITQGGCSTRPGVIYQNFISRRFDANYLNLGFSGNAKGESVMGEYISGLNMLAFVFDYDWNAPDVKSLEQTHEAFYKTVRSTHEDMPIIICSRPKFVLNADDEARRAVVMKTYENALKRGENVAFLDGPALMKECKNDGTVDNCHPNDFGFYSMSKAIGDVLSEKCFND